MHSWWYTEKHMLFLILLRLSGVHLIFGAWPLCIIKKENYVVPRQNVDDNNDYYKQIGKIMILKGFLWNNDLFYGASF